MDNKDQVKLVPCKEFIGSSESSKSTSLVNAATYGFVSGSTESCESHAGESLQVQLLFIWVLLVGYFEQLYIHVGQLLGTNKILHVYVHIEDFLNF